ncbi:hypothetical protein DK926_19005 [Rhodococcus sp. Eu-32]|uniref:hypothetical protein n=1 Tax=Rhodococcus sp. Eu-32 TaxID=1017319 RepID=UPI000F774164|nr:hypothetical protein [Rhodococcus sp. Eu-32]RRQ26332.1 hypothetical protein DK926_19005 [Rhodococcus sp. Eu-32]
MITTNDQIETLDLDHAQSARYVIWAASDFRGLDLVPLGDSVYDVTESISRNVIARVRLTEN